MSQVSALAFIRRLASDPDFAKKIMTAPDVGSRIRLASEEGYEVSPEELATHGDYLGDSELVSIAGGCKIIDVIHEKHLDP